jgi:hypothetical protein
VTISRRKMIASAAASAFVLTGGAGAWRVTRRPTTALMPWTLNPEPPTDVRLDAFRHAILAPNPHNRQPWLIRLEGDNDATISCDLTRLLPETDPFNRQIMIGFGAFLELARIAAAQRGTRMEMAAFPEGEPEPRVDARPIAHLRFVPEPAILRDPLFGGIPKRRTNRLIYDPARAVSDQVARHIAEGPYLVEASEIEAIRAVTVAAMTTEQTTARTFQESIQLMRIGANEVDAKPDGLTLIGPKMEALKLLGILDKSALADQSTTAFKTGLDMQAKICGSIPALMWIITPRNSRLDQLEAGRRYVRANLRATISGIAMHPLSQSLQEYAEMERGFSQIHRLLGAKSGERVQMLARMGYALPVEPSPRWPLETHLQA